MENESIEFLVRGVCLKEGKVLLCRTIGHENTYLPGGHIEYKEGAREALEREIDEELGVHSSAGRFLGAVENSFMQHGERHCEINLLFDLAIDELTPDTKPESQEDHIEFHWGELDGLSDWRLEPKLLCNQLRVWLKSSADCWVSGYEE